MTKRLLLKGILTVSSIALLAACSPEETNDQTQMNDTPDTSEISEEDHEGMMHDESGEIPEGFGRGG